MSDTAIIGDKADVLEQRWSEKTAGSAHAFVRGNTIQHYKLLNELPPLPDGPPIWICGDCHVGNLGPIADRDGTRRLPDPRSRSKRLAIPRKTSSDWPCRWPALRGVRIPRRDDRADRRKRPRRLHRQTERARRPRAGEGASHGRQRAALGRKWHHLANERLGDVRPAIPLGRKFWELSDDERWSIGTVIDSSDVKTLILALNKRSERAKVELVDAAYWIKAAARWASGYAALVHLSGGT